MPKRTGQAGADPEWLEGWSCFCGSYDCSVCGQMFDLAELTLKFDDDASSRVVRPVKPLEHALTKHWIANVEHKFYAEDRIAYDLDRVFRNPQGHAPSWRGVYWLSKWIRPSRVAKFRFRDVTLAIASTSVLCLSMLSAFRTCHR